MMVHMDDTYPPLLETMLEDLNNIQFWDLPREEDHGDQRQDALEDRRGQLSDLAECAPDDYEALLDDPENLVLNEIASVASHMGRLRSRLNLLIAYAREFTPDPPRLAQIAQAADVSKTHVSRMYGDAEIRQLELLLGVTSPRSARAALAERQAASRNQAQQADHADRPR